MESETRSKVNLVVTGSGNTTLPNGIREFLEMFLNMAQIQAKATFTTTGRVAKLTRGQIIEIGLEPGYSAQLRVSLAPAGKGSARFGILQIHDFEKGKLQGSMPEIRNVVERINRYSSLRKLKESCSEFCDDPDSDEGSQIIATTIASCDHAEATQHVVTPKSVAPAHNPHSQSNAEEVWNDADRLQRFAAEMLKFPNGFVPIEVLKTEIRVQLDMPEQLLAKTVIKLSDGGYCTMCKVDEVIGFTFNAQPPSKPYLVKPKIDNTSRVEVNPDTILAFIVSTLSDGEDEIQVLHAEFTAKMREYFGLVDNPQASGWVMKRVLASGYVQKRLVDKIPFCFVYRSPASTVLANKQQPEVSDATTAKANSEVKRPVGRPKKVVSKSDALSMIENIRAKIAEVQGSLKALTDEVAQLKQLL